MLLKNIYEKNIERSIEGVVKADDQEGLSNEIQEYVLTGEISSRLSNFLQAYNSGGGSNGAWISGFYGSGKSHLLKMLSYLLENRPIDDLDLASVFLEKTDDAILQGDIRKAVSIPSKSILFNVDQSATVLEKTKSDRLLGVFSKVFNEMCGYFGKHGHIAKFERDLDSKGQLQAFRDTYQRIAGRTWEIGRTQELFEKNNIGQAFAEVTGEQSDPEILSKYREDYSLSIADFAEQVDNYIKSQEKGFRLNFFVDEVGQYIADDVKLMTNLQTIAESLHTKCSGKAWIIVTAQEDMEKIVGEMNRNQANDFSKIQARFEHRMKLTSQNVADVIQKRLLAKTDDATKLIETIYRDHGANFRTILSFSDGSRKYKNYADEAHFVQVYPFVPYQFELFKSATEQLSAYNHFEGSHASTGERTLLAVFQQVAKAMKNNELGTLATFDAMFEGISQTLKSQVTTSIAKAENQLTDPYAVRVLKALYLVKYVGEFKPTLRNICVLMHDRVDADTSEIKKKVEKALFALTDGSYIRRNGELYEYLTHEEKDIEEEIKQTQLDPDVQAKELLSLVFDDILGASDRKIGLQPGGHQYNYTRKLDDSPHGGREHDLAINVISPFHDRAGNLQMLRANNMGKDELLLILDPSKDKRLFPELTRYLKTEKYIKQNRGNFDAQDQKARILAEKGQQIIALKSELRERVRELISTADFMAGGTDITVAGSDSKGRIVDGFQQLLRITYPHLRMLKDVIYAESSLQKIVDGKNDLLGADAEPMTEAQKDVLSRIQLLDKSKEHMTVKTLITHYESKPYGWPMAATLHQIANLNVRGNIELSLNSDPLEGRQMVDAIKNTHSQASIKVRLQQEYDRGSIRKLTSFFTEMFGQPPQKTDARSLAEETRQQMINLRSEIQSARGQEAQYPFSASLDAPLSQIEQHAEKNFDYYLGHIAEFSEPLLALNEDIISPILNAMKGEKGKIYQAARDFYIQHSATLARIDTSASQRLKDSLDAPDIYKGAKLRSLDDLRKALTAQIDDALEKSRATNLIRIKNLEKVFKESPDYADLDPAAQSKFDNEFNGIYGTIDRADNLSVMESMTEAFTGERYSALLTDAARTKAEKEGIKAPEIEVVSLSALINTSGRVLRSVDDVDAYIETVKAALLEALANGKQVRP